MPAASLPLSGQELVPLVQNGANVATPANNLGAGGTGGTYAYEIDVPTGLTATVTKVGTLVLFNSASMGAKSVTIPTSTGSKGIITIKDYYGSATSQYPIVPVPVTGTIKDNSQVYTPYGSITLYDSSVGWVGI
jgi:hypothetical protein